MDGTDTYVLHCGGSIFRTGTLEDVTAYHNIPRDYDTSSWAISTLDDYGQSQYDRGFDCGYDEASGESYIL